MPLRMYDPEGDREKASVKDKKKRIKTESDKRPGPKSGFAPKEEPRTPKPMLSGGQAKLDKNKNNRIDAQDFKILRKEKAKGRGQGLQDEKMKPGKPMKAALGAIALGLGAKKMKQKGKMMPMGIGAAGYLAKKKKEMLGKKRGGPILKKDPSKPVNPFEKRAKKFSKVKKILKGVGRLGIAGAALGAAGAGAAMLGRKIGKKLDEAKKKNKKMGGGMMDEKTREKIQKQKVKLGLGVFDEKGNFQAKKRKKMMGGGMMQRPGYNVGGSVTVKTKLGRNKPTKMY